jgi:NAD(P)-dependent dehydrogenase (short-subunit alcohol dehydrogenase family)
MFEHDSLRDRVVVVTGGGRGFGWLIGQALLKQGAKVVLTATRHPQELEARVQDVAGFGAADRCHTVVGDVCDPQSCTEVIEATLDRFGRVDVLMNNAGRGTGEYRMSMTEPVPFYEIPIEGWRTIINTNLNGTFFMTRAAIPHMLAQGFGKIVNFSTSLTTMVGFGLSGYGASKAGIETATVVWAKELTDTGVDVNVLLPGGASDTDFITQSMMPGKVGERGGPLLPANVIVPPALWLASDLSNGVSGRRLIGKFWDHDKSVAESVAACMEAAHATPRVM